MSITFKEPRECRLTGSLIVRLLCSSPCMSVCVRAGMCVLKINIENILCVCAFVYVCVNETSKMHAGRGGVIYREYAER